MMEQLDSFKRGDFAHIDYERIGRDMRIAYVKYGGLVAERIQDIRDARRNDGRYHRVFSIVKGMLSSGLKLEVNIRAGRLISDLILIDPDIKLDAIITALRDARLYQGRSPETACRNVYNAIPFIVLVEDSGMTYGNLIAVPGIGPKIASWILSVYFGDVRRFTIDVHMYRGLFGTGNATTDRIHQDLEECMLQLVERVFPDVPPLVVQWSLWCMYRDDRWDPHHGIVRSDG